MNHFSDEWNVQSGLLTYGENQLRCVRMGLGKKVLIAFHGFGQDAMTYEPLARLIGEEYTLISFDFPGDSASLWKGRKMPDLKVLYYFIQRICAEFQVDKVSLMGFSMGARPALCLTGYMSEKVEELILLAPDGLKKNIWFYLATHNIYGKLLFRQVLKNPKKWSDYLEKLVRLGVVKKQWHLLASNALANPSLMEKVNIAWPFTRNFIPQQHFIQKKIRKKKIPLLLFMGNRDVVFPPEEGNTFIQGLPTAEMHVLNSGHQLLKSGNLPFIANVLLKKK